jgi:hypothetical protein
MPFQLARLQAHPPQLMLSVEQGELVSWCLGPALDAQVELQQAREVEIPILLPPVLQVLPLVRPVSFMVGIKCTANKNSHEAITDCKCPQ